MGNQVIEVDCFFNYEPGRCREIGWLPLRSDANIGLAHEGGGKGKLHVAMIEASQYGCTPCFEMRKYLVEYFGIATDIADPLVFSCVLFGSHDPVVRCGLPPGLVLLPDDEIIRTHV